MQTGETLLPDSVGASGIQSGLLGQALLFENIWDAIIITDQAGLVLDWNPAATRMFGYTREEMLGKSPALVHPPAAHPTLQNEIMDALRQHGRWSGESELVDKQGSRKVCDVTIFQLKNLQGEVIGAVGVNHDITDRKQVEETLRRAENLYRQLVEKAMAVLYLDAVNASSSALYISPQVETLFGYTQEEWVNLPDLWINMLYPEDRERVTQEHLRTNTTGDPFIIEYRLVARDGRVLWIHDEATLSLDDEGRPKYWQGVMLDITARKTIELALQESESKNRAILEALPDLMFRFNGEGMLLDSRAPQENLLAAPLEEMVDRNIQDVLPDRAGDLLETIRKTLTTGEAQSFEYVLWVGKDQRFFEARMVVSGVAEVLTIVRDITDRKRAEQIVRQVSAYNRGLIEASLDPFVFFDPQGLITDVNKAAELVTGLPRHKLIGTDFFSYFTQPERTRTAYQRVFREGVLMDLESEIRHRNGGITPVLVNASVYRDELGKLVGVFAAARDITDRKQVEEKLRYLIYHDALTDIYNRAFFEEEFTRLKLSRSYPLSILMVDVDNLKTTNDTLGHEAGDRLLARAARVLANSFRPEDVVARIGGDEFAVLLPSTNHSAATQALERVQLHLAEQNREYSGLPLSLSMGVATASHPAQSADVFRLADEAMYQVKLRQKSQDAARGAQ